MSATKRNTLIVSKNRLMSPGRTKKWRDAIRQGHVGKAGPCPLFWPLLRAHHLSCFRNFREVTGWWWGRAELHYPPVSENFWLLLSSLEKLNWQEITYLLSYKVANVVKCFFRKSPATGECADVIRSRTLKTISAGGGLSLFLPHFLISMSSGV